jgi:hypothetical protein
MKGNSMMEIDDSITLQHKLDYLKLALKISKLRYHGEEPHIDLIMQAREAGCLAGISHEELNKL